jgi:DNA-directed RNA polymerase II subunit RPB1
METISARIMQEFEGDLKCWHSDDNARNLVILARIINEDKSMEEDDRLEEDMFLKRIEQNILNDITLCGIKGIQRAFISEEKRTLIDEKTNSYQESVGWFLETDGINLLEVMAFNGVDPTRTVSNSIIETMEVLGIEATRAAIVNEIRNVVSSSGGYVNYRHLSLLCDIMTFKGQLMAITRHGINRQQSGVLARCSFEETVELLVDAAGLGEVDVCRGVSENIILGQIAPLGTGDFEVLLNEDMLEQILTVPGRFMNDNYSMIDSGFMSPAHTPYVDRAVSPVSSPRYFYIILIGQWWIFAYQSCRILSVRSRWIHSGS